MAQNYNNPPEYNNSHNKINFNPPSYDEAIGSHVLTDYKKLNRKDSLNVSNLWSDKDNHGSPLQYNAGLISPIIPSAPAVENQTTRIIDTGRIAETTPLQQNISRNRSRDITEQRTVSSMHDKLANSSIYLMMSVICGCSMLLAIFYSFIMLVVGLAYRLAIQNECPKTISLMLLSIGGIAVFVYTFRIIVTDKIRAKTQLNAGVCILFYFAIKIGFEIFLIASIYLSIKEFLKDEDQPEMEENCNPMVLTYTQVSIIIQIIFYTVLLIACPLSLVPCAAKYVRVFRSRNSDNVTRV